MKCHACGDKLPSGARFCPTCGVSTVPDDRIAVEDAHRENQKGTVVCRNCGSENDADLTHCASCGMRLTAAGRRNGEAVQQQKKQTADISRKGRRRTKIESWHIAIILASVAVIFIVMYFMAKNDHEMQVAPSPQAMNTPIAPDAKAEIERLENAVKVNPQDAAARLSLANALHDNRKFTEAIGEYKEYLRNNPRDVDARVDMGICYFEMGDFQAARAEMKKGLSINPKHQLAFYNLGIVDLQERNIPEARKWFEETIAIDSTTEIGKRARMMVQEHSFPMKSK